MSAREGRAVNDGRLQAPAAPPRQPLRQNNFDLLRFVFAFMVFLVHAHVLSGVQEFGVFSRYLSSDFAVKSFFVVSGFLIFMSYENSRSVPAYFGKRIRRIYPAYAFVILASVVLGAFFSSFALSDYWSLPLLKYIAANLLFLNFLQPDLPGLFQHSAYQAVNGALWTLKIEVMFYLLVPLAVMAFARLGRLPVLALLYVGSVIYSAGMGTLAAQTGSGLYFELQRQLPGQLCFFVAGAAAYYYFTHLSRYALPLMIAAVTAFVLQDWLPWMLVQPLALGVVVVYLACFLPYLGNFGKYGDFSYGIYIVHFPVLQLLIASGRYDDVPWLMLLSAMALVVTTAILLWHFIEKPFLRRSSHYVETNRV
jgi:peptidoglycan/LPS O-acetylase OafA/YrhL